MIGRVIIKNILAKNIIVAYQDANHVINFEALFNTNPIVKDEFINQLNIFSFNFFYNWHPPCVGCSNQGQPPIDDKVFYNLEYCNQVVSIIMDEINNNDYQDCIEMQILKPIVISNAVYGFSPHHLTNFDEVSIFTVPHPLTNDNFGNGYQLYTNSEGQDQGYNITFDLNFVNSKDKNVIVVRPVRNQTCSYNDINVMDFTTFLNN